MFGVAYRVLRTSGASKRSAPLLAGKMLAVALLAFAAILLLSNLVTALSTFFLAKDLDMLVAAPVDWIWLYLSKLGETLVHSSWMVVLMVVPILTAVRQRLRRRAAVSLRGARGAAAVFPAPTVIGAVATLVLVNVFPARRARDLLSLVALAAAGGLVLFLRVLRPEQLARPEGYRNLLEFISTLSRSEPSAPAERVGLRRADELAPSDRRIRFRSCCSGPPPAPSS